MGVLWLAIAIGLSAWLSVRARSFPVGVFTVLLMVFYAVRGLGVGLGFDESVHVNRLTGAEIPGVMNRVGVVVFLFVLCFVVGYVGSRQTSMLIAPSLPIPSRQLSSRSVLLAMMTFACLALAIAVSQILLHGSFNSAIAASKSDRATGGALLRIPATLAIILSAANLRRLVANGGSRGRRGLVVISFTCLAAGAWAASVWGSRQFIIIALGFVLLAPAIDSFRSKRQGWLGRSGATAAILLSVGLGLRLYRDDALGGETAVTAAEGDLYRQLSIASNGALFDNALLAVRDFPDRFAYRGGTDFYVGLWGSVPRSLRPKGLEFDSIGAMFHRLYNPAATSGWPVGAPFEWFINFGWPGVMLGGLLSGFIYRALTEMLRRSPMPSFATMTTLVMAMVVFPLGLSTSSPNRFVVHALPLLLFLRSTRSESTPSAEPDLDAHPRDRGFHHA